MPSPTCATGAVREETWDDVQPQVILRYEAERRSQSLRQLQPRLPQRRLQPDRRRHGGGGQRLLRRRRHVRPGNRRHIRDSASRARSSTAARISAPAPIDTNAEGTYYFIFIAANSTQNLGNIDEVEYQGIDLEFNARLTDNFSVNAGFGYTDSEITSFPDPVVDRRQGAAGVGLHAQSRRPVHDAALGRCRRAGAASTITASATPCSRSRSARPRWRSTPSRSTRDPVDLVDLRVGIQGDAWSLMAWSRNLLDEEYNTEYSPGGFLFKAQPMRWGVELTRRF